MPSQHIISGGALPKSIPDADNCLVWRDDLSVGPVPATATLGELSRIREAFWQRPTAWRRLGEAERDRYLAQAGKAIRAKAQKLDRHHSLTERDRAFAAIAKSDEVVVWCGPNRRETLMLGAVLHFGLRREQVKLAPCGTSGFGPCNESQLKQAFAQRQTCTTDALDLWRAYTSSSPDHLKELKSRVAARILEEYPSATQGLSLMEERMLGLVDKHRSILSILAEALGQVEEPIGDQLPLETLWDFVMGPAPLLEPLDNRPLQLASSAKFRTLGVRLSPLGREVLAGQRDYVSCGTVDRWVGGVHLLGTSIPWRR